MDHDVSGRLSVSSDHTAGGPSSQAAQETVHRNQKVFNRYAASFAHMNEPARFLEDATKFVKWLENPKGYYDAARPQILKLAMIMQCTLRRATGVPESLSHPFPLQAHVHHPLSECYVALVRTIYRFRHLFVDPDMQVLLRKLFDSANLPEDIPEAGAAQSPPLATPSPWTTGPLQQDNVYSQSTPNAAVQFTEPVPPGMHPPQVIASGPPQSAPPLPHGHTQGQATASISGNPTSTNDATRKSQPNLQEAFSIPPRNVQDWSPIVESNARGIDMDRSLPVLSVTPSTAAAEPLTAKTKKKKRRKASLDISKYEDLDVQTFLAKKEQLHSPTIPPRAVPSISGVLAISAQPEAEIARAPKEVIVLDTPSPPVVPDVAVKPEPQEVTIPRSQSFIARQHEVIDLTLSDDEEDHMVVDRALANAVPEEPTASMDVDASPVLTAEPGSQGELSSGVGHEEPLAAVAGLDQQDEVASEAAAAIPQGDEGGEKEMELDSESSRHATSAQSMDLDIAPAAVPALSAPTLAAEHISEVATEAGPEAVDALSNGTPRGGESSMENTGESLESEEQEVSSMNVEEAQHEGDVDMNAEQRPHESVQTPLSQATEIAGLHEHDMQVVVRVRGEGKKSRLAFEMNVDEEQYKSIMTWSAQKASISELKHSQCISLACYPATQVNPSLLESQVHLLTSSWPEQGGLTLKVEFNENMETFSLAPPLFLSPDSTVDLSMFVKPGKNQFFINQYKDWSDYYFALLRHRPTKKQIEDVERKRREEEEWQGWLKEMAKPIQIDMPSPQAIAVN